MTILNSRDIPHIQNMEAMPHGTGARYLECTTHDSETGREYIAYCWRRKLPKGISPWHVIIDFTHKTEREVSK